MGSIFFSLEDDLSALRYSLSQVYTEFVSSTKSGPRDAGSSTIAWTLSLGSSTGFTMTFSAWNVIFTFSFPYVPLDVAFNDNW